MSKFTPNLKLNLVLDDTQRLIKMLKIYMVEIYGNDLDKIYFLILSLVFSIFLFCHWVFLLK